MTLVISLLKPFFFTLPSSACSSCSTCGDRLSCRCSITALMSHPITDTTLSGRTWPSPWSWSSPSFTHTPSVDHQRSASHPLQQDDQCQRNLWPLLRAWIFVVLSFNARFKLCLLFTACSPGQQQYPARSNPVDGHFLPAGYLPRRGEKQIEI